MTTKQIHILKVHKDKMVLTVDTRVNESRLILSTPHLDALKNNKHISCRVLTNIKIQSVCKVKDTKFDASCLVHVLMLLELNGYGYNF